MEKVKLFLSAGACRHAVTPQLRPQGKVSSAFAQKLRRDRLPWHRPPRRACETRVSVICQRGLNPNPKSRMISTVPMTLDQIVEETRHWPPEKVGELVGLLTEDLHTGDPEIGAAWQTEIARRVEEIQSGKVQGIPGEEVSTRVRKIVGR